LLIEVIDIEEAYGEETEMSTFDVKIVGFPNMLQYFK